MALAGAVSVPVENGESNGCEPARPEEPPTLCASSKSCSSVPEESSTPSVSFEFKVEQSFHVSGEIKKLLDSSKYNLICKFPNGKPTVAELRTTFDSLGFEGIFELGLIDPKHVLVIFSQEEDYIRIFLQPIWSICGYLMKVFKWTINFNPSVECPIVPVWISLPNLPMNFLEKSLLFSVLSGIGTPLMMDETNADQSIVSKPRVCIELDLRLPRTHRVCIGTKEYSFWQEVEYENIPNYCSQCLHHGHTIHECYLFDKMLNRIISVAATNNKDCNGNDNVGRIKEKGVEFVAENQMEREVDEFSSEFVNEKDDASTNSDESEDVEVVSFSSASARTSRTKRGRPRKIERGEKRNVVSISSASAQTSRTKRRRQRKRERGEKRKERRETKLILWEKPDDGFVKLNTDGCLKRMQIPSGDCSGGGILRNHEGEVIFAFHEYYGTSCVSALAAELEALLAGLKICHKRGYKNIWAELDSKVGVRCLTNPAAHFYLLRSPRQVRLLVDEILRLSSFLNVHCSYIYREANSAADFLANEGFRSKTRKIMEENELPDDLKDIIRFERLNTPYARKIWVKHSG